MTRTSSPAAQRRRFTLQRPTIEVAAAEIRFHGREGGIGQEDALELRDGLAAAGFVYRNITPTLQQQVMISFAEQGGQAVSGSATQGWVLSDDKRAVQLTVMPAALILQATTYERWSVTFEPLLQALLPLIGQLLGLTVHTRVGLRYVNRVADPGVTRVDGWTGKIRAGLLGPVADVSLSQHLLEAQQTIVLGNPDGTRTVLRHGPFSDPATHGSYSYLLDIDVFDERTERFTVDAALAAFVALNRTAASLFLEALERAYADELGLNFEKEEAP